jgi:hypothetical protein
MAAHVRCLVFVFQPENLKKANTPDIRIRERKLLKQIL